MLVLTRRKGESILIGDDIEITLVKVEDGAAKISIKAPKDVQILRKELYVEVEKENISATDMDMSILKNIKK